MNRLFIRHRRGTFCLFGSSDAAEIFPHRIFSLLIVSEMLLSQSRAVSERFVWPTIDIRAILEGSFLQWLLSSWGRDDYLADASTLILIVHLKRNELVRQENKWRRRLLTSKVLRRSGVRDTFMVVPERISSSNSTWDVFKR